MTGVAVCELCSAFRILFSCFRRSRGSCDLLNSIAVLGEGDRSTVHVVQRLRAYDECKMPRQ